jgi:ATP synthase protein I
MAAARQPVVPAGGFPMPLLDPEGKKQLKVAARVGAVGLELILAIGFGYFGGVWLDGKLGTTPYLTIAGFVVGLIAGFKSLWNVAKRTKMDSL